jgi:multidrug transporter EmrE-like cation transporter
MIEAILGGATPVALGAALPIVAGLLFNYLSTGFLFTVVLPTILGVLGIKLAVFTGALTFISGPIGWGIAGGVGLVATLLAGSKFFKQRDEVLLIMTILSIYTCTYQNQMPTLPGN